MGRTQRTLDRFRQRVDELIADFDHFLDVFEGTGLFTGPSVYFHQKTIAALRDSDSVSSALQDDEFLDLIYATLTAWGMHRMGPDGAKMGEAEPFRASIRRHQAEIEALSSLRIGALDQPPAALARRVWTIIDDLDASATDTKIVAGTKALHHLLPGLVPPIDRRYTVRFFFETTTFRGSGEDTFLDAFPHFGRIASACESVISNRLGTSPMSTSATKIIDNAIVGYVLERLPKRA